MLKHCHQCGYEQPESEVIAGVCLTCRASRIEDERPVTAVLSPMNRQPKPNPQKKVCGAGIRG